MTFRLNSHLHLVSIFAVLVLQSGCGTGVKRIFSGAAIGASIGAVGGFGLSPNDESRGMNSLVFGLTGAVAGGLIGAITDTSPSAGDSPTTLKDRDLEIGTTLYQVESKSTLPEFVKARLQPVIIEEFTNKDSVDEDGALHEPHRVYRIKRNGELFPLPKKASLKKPGGAK